MDWKTNKEIKFKAFRGEKGFGPLDAIENCNFKHYSLQLCTYLNIVREEGYYEGENFEGVGIMHITPEKVIEYQVDDLRQESLKILSLRA